VSGQGEVRATPDRAQLSFAVETTATKAGEAAAESARRSAAVGAAVNRLLGAGGTVATTRYSIEPRYETSPWGSPRCRTPRAAPIARRPPVPPSTSPTSSVPTGPPTDASTRSPATSAPSCAPSPPAARRCSAGTST